MEKLIKKTVKSILKQLEGKNWGYPIYQLVLSVNDGLYFGRYNSDGTFESREKFRIFVKIDDSGSARLLSFPDEGMVLTRIPINEKIEVFASKRINRGMTSVLWYKVEYKGEKGWISQYVTTGRLLKEPIN